MIMQAQGQTMPSLTFEMLRVATGSGTILIKAEQGGIKSIGIKGFQIPTDHNGQLWVHYARNDASIYVPAVNVLEKNVAPDMIAGKLVLIGTSAVGLNDIKTTPVSRAMPGVEIHAQVLESALDRRSDLAADLRHRRRIRDRAAVRADGDRVRAAVRTGHAGRAWRGIRQHAGRALGLFLYQQPVADRFTYPLMSTTAIYLTLIFSSFVREQAQRRQIRSAFGQYLSPALVEQLAQSPEKLVLGGEEREMTIMFSDMRGFTSISETYKNDPQGLTALMNRFLTPLTNAILNRKGTIDKYMGDAIMAFWNAPLDDKNHELNACEAALDMLERVDELNADARAGGKGEQAARSFRSTPASGSTPVLAWSATWGPTSASTIRCSATASIWRRASKDSPRNTAFRSSSGSKTALAVKDRFAILELDFIMVKGKKEPEVIYAIAGHEDTAQSGRFQRLRNLTIEMLACYRARDWDGALAAIARGRKTDEANRWSCSTISMRRASAAISKTRRRKTGTVRSRC